MIKPAYVQKMAAYNRWMNEGIYAACEALCDEDRKKDCGAFFKSIHGTLNHILWGDQIWMHRFAGTPQPSAEGIPGSSSQYDSFDELKQERVAFDQVIEDWAGHVGPDWLDETLEWYSGSMGRDMSSPHWVLVTQMFNHQTHHRGQVHCLLTQFGVKTPTTDLPFMP
jgi:uncharacterized damage-inducible protein DinB